MKKRYFNFKRTKALTLKALQKSSLTLKTRKTQYRVTNAKLFCLEICFKHLAKCIYPFHFRTPIKGNVQHS